MSTAAVLDCARAFFRAVHVPWALAHAWSSSGPDHRSTDRAPCPRAARRREKAGPAPEEALARGLRAVGGAAQAFRDAGWDGKTGPWGDRGQVVEEEEEQERDEQEEDGKEDEEAEVEEQEGSDGATGQAGGPAAGGRGGARGKGSWAAGLWRVLEV